MSVLDFKPRAGKPGYEDELFAQMLRPISCDGLLTQEQVVETFFNLILSGGKIMENESQAREYFREQLLPGLAVSLAAKGLYVEDLTT